MPAGYLEGRAPDVPCLLVHRGKHHVASLPISGAGQRRQMADLQRGQNACIDRVAPIQRGDPPLRRGLWGLNPKEEEVLPVRSEEHTSELQSLRHLVCRLLLEKKKRT